LELARVAVNRLQDSARALKALCRKRDALASHLEGFYKEIDKLTKSKALVEVSPLMVEQANEVIGDAKGIVTGDIYLDRIKQFVPAGNNPQFQDVLVAMRGVLQCLERCAKEFEARRNRISDRLLKANTTAAALELILGSGVDKEPTQNEVVASIRGAQVSESLFHGGYGTKHFDLDMIDSCDLEAFLSEDGNMDAARGPSEEEDKEAEAVEAVELDELASDAEDE
jgi:hypothetical protein